MSFFKNLFKDKNKIEDNTEEIAKNDEIELINQENEGSVSETEGDTPGEELAEENVGSVPVHETSSKLDMQETAELLENTLEEVFSDLQEELNTDPAELEPDNNSEQEAVEEIKEKKGFFEKVFQGLDKTRKNFIGNVESVLKSFTKIDEELFEELEETLIMADIGVETSTFIIESVKDKIRKQKLTEVEAVKNLIAEEITEILESETEDFILETPSIILVIGVNGVGKTTTIGKLTHNYQQQGKKVILAAADTFRAAAIDQLEVWGQRNNVDVIKHQENSDPGAVVFDAVQATKARKADILICDTAGRLHNKKNLMEELKKIYKIINREFSEAHIEVFLVLDATTGQNALQQAKLFKEAADITGIVLTKLDGTAKGGIVIGIKNELKIPVRYIGVGEGIDDLQEFNASDFSKALFGLVKE